MTDLLDDDDERTRVSRVAPASAPDEDDDERTRVSRVAPASAPDEDDDERTRVSRVAPASAPDEDDDERTNVATNDDPDGRTVVARKAKKAPVLDAGSGTSGRRRGIAEPPVPRGFAPRAVKASGAGAVSEYTPRPITPPPAPPQLPTLAPDATRVPSPHLPSVRARSHRTARRAIVTFVITCVLAAAGAVAVVLAILKL